jgi:branched-chain amino acid transport system permease protein
MSTQATLVRVGAVVGTLLLLFALNFVLPAVLHPVAFRVLTLCGIAVIMAVSLNLVNGFTGQFSIGHAGFQAVGAYTAACLTVYGHNLLFANLPKNGRLPAYTEGFLKDAPTVDAFFQGAPAAILAILAGGLVAALVGYVVGLPSLRLRGDYLAIVTLGFGEIIRVAVENTPALGGSLGFTSVEGVRVPNVAKMNFFWVGLMVVITILVARNLRYSAHGLQYFAVREDEVAAQAMGVNTTKIKVSAFALGSFFAGVAGALYALFQQTFSATDFNFIRSFDFVTMVVLGGLGSITGSTLAAVFLIALPEVLRFTLGEGAVKYRLVAYALLLIILMLVRPQGIFGRGELNLNFLRRKRGTDAAKPGEQVAG